MLQAACCPDRDGISSSKDIFRPKPSCLDARDKMRYKVKLDSVACIGCVACTRCEIFEMRPDMKAHAIQNIVSDVYCIADVAEDCPVGAITFSRIVSED